MIIISSLLYSKTERCNCVGYHTQVPGSFPDGTFAFPPVTRTCHKSYKVVGSKLHSSEDFTVLTSPKHLYFFNLHATWKVTQYWPLKKLECRVSTWFYTVEIQIFVCPIYITYMHIHQYLVYLEMFLCITFLNTLSTEY